MPFTGISNLLSQLRENIPPVASARDLTCSRPMLGNHGFSRLGCPNICRKFGGWPTLSFWNLDFPSKVGAPSFAATPGSPASGLGSLGWSSDGWVYRRVPHLRDGFIVAKVGRLPPNPKDFFREFPRIIACQAPRPTQINSTNRKQMRKDFHPSGIVVMLRLLQLIYGHCCPTNDLPFCGN